MQLEVNDIEVDCIIGERPDERTRLQRLLISVSLEVSDKAAETDELSDAVDYVALADAIRARLVAGKCKMIERAARLVAEVAIGFCGVSAVSASVRKSGAVTGIGCAIATYRIEKEGEGCQQRKPWWRF